MPCFKPLHGFKSPTTGKWISVQSTNRLDLEEMTIPCGKCTGCRTEYSRQWAVRCHLEQKWQEKFNRNSVFITLTYDDDHLPPFGSLRKKDFVDFMKRLRKQKNSTSDNPLRFYACGEYGEKSGRPHYHAILFNCSFKQDKEIKKGKNPIYWSKDLQKAWSHYIQPKEGEKKGKHIPIGFVSWGKVTFESAAYVANYVQKKINGALKEEHYKRYYDIDQDGEIILNSDGEFNTQIESEFSLMSRKPGIAADWLTYYKDDVYPSDFLTVNGRKMKPPKSFDRQYERDHASEMAAIKELRKEGMLETAHLRTPEALAYQEKVHKARMSLYQKRKL